MSATKTMAQTQNGMDDTALAVPRVAPRGLAGIALPAPLALSDAARIRRIFALQARGRIPEAIREADALDASDGLIRDMLGHILADRHLGPTTRPGVAALQDWLANWPRLPDAPAIHSLLDIRSPRGSRPASAGVLPFLAAAQTQNDARPPAAPLLDEAAIGDQLPNRNATLDHAVRAAARSGPPGAASRLIARTRGLPPLYAAQLKGEAAQILFVQNRDEEAYALAASGVAGCRLDACDGAAMAGFQAGLAAWRMGRPDLSRPMFEAAWRSRVTTPALRAAAAYWAGRAHQRLHDDDNALLWTKLAAASRHSFYGLLARRTLGLSAGLPAGGREVLAEADLDAVVSTPEGLRAFALLQAGQPARAEAELRQLWPTSKSIPGLGRAIMLVADKAGLADLAAQLAGIAQAADGQPRENLRFPMPRLAPSGGFSVDPALVYALTRTESNFEVGLVSPAGARGLMQIMPETARFVSGGKTGGEAATADLQLHDPAVNLAVGQRYVAHLASLDIIAGDLIRLLASYNSGPGSFARWSQSVRHDGDPLLFIEAVPVDETRAFIPRVLAYYWMYAGRMRLAAPSLADLADGLWPHYVGAPPRIERSASLH